MSSKGFSSLPYGTSVSQMVARCLTEETVGEAIVLDLLQERTATPISLPLRSGL